MTDLYAKTGKNIRAASNLIGAASTVTLTLGAIWGIVTADLPMAYKIGLTGGVMFTWAVLLSWLAEQFRE